MNMCLPKYKAPWILYYYETQSNLTVASLLGGLWWVIYFSFDTFLKKITLPSKVKNDDVILRSSYDDDIILRRALDDDVTFRRALDYDVTFRCALDDVVTFRWSLKDDVTVRMA